MTIQPFAIGSRQIGAGHPCYIVAEVSANHNHSLERAVEIIRSARRAGADAIKLQTYTADTLTIDCNLDWFRVPGDSPWAGKTLYELYSEAYTPWEWHPQLFQVARDEGLDCFSTPFDATAVQFLEQLEVPAYKLASFELVDTGLIESIGRTGKPVIMSTGMATLSEIEDAVLTLRSTGAHQMALLKCTSTYPAAPDSMNLRTIPHLSQSFNVVAGLSDHTMGGAVAVAAVTLGAAIIEKHFTLSRFDGGPDAAFSMEPAEFAQMVADIPPGRARVRPRVLRAHSSGSHEPRVSSFTVRCQRRPRRRTTHADEHPIDPAKPRATPTSSQADFGSNGSDRYLSRDASSLVDDR